jgi:hypothetical protein
VFYQHFNCRLCSGNVSYLVNYNDSFSFRFVQSFYHGRDAIDLATRDSCYHKKNKNGVELVNKRICIFWVVVYM